MTENIYSIQDNVKLTFDNVNNACIRANRHFDDVMIMGVSKTKSIEEVKQAIDAGVKLFGENKVQELIEKDVVFKEHSLLCHIIGSLQTNKVKYLPPLTNYIQSVDSIKLAQEISRQYLKAEKVANILIEVNIGQEESKSGISKESLMDFVYEVSELPGV
ncbi:MAG: YggS family pyridoxal phosphate-dependent enzyme, partial [Oscillospiraceae bacterium]